MNEKNITVHAFTNTGREVARMLITVTPGTQHEGFFREECTGKEKSNDMFKGRKPGF